ncbi:hypothetical protein DRN43_05855 [Thermococci archaeon]|nr:MAG: hypothetical protein DRN43_05855 [Thermococci archaeon]
MASLRSAVLVIVALLVLASMLQFTVKHMESEEELKAVSVFTSFVHQARATVSAGTSLPDPNSYPLPEGCNITISGCNAELRCSGKLLAQRSIC